jgi:hypothetical protein
MIKIDHLLTICTKKKTSNEKNQVILGLSICRKYLDLYETKKNQSIHMNRWQTCLWLVF